MLNLLDEELLGVGIVGLREAEDFGHGELPFGDVARSEQDLTEYGVDTGRDRSLFGSRLAEGEGFREAMLA
jgi:hypothetical protein